MPKPELPKVENAKLKALSVITFQCSDCNSNFSNLPLLEAHMKRCKAGKKKKPSQPRADLNLTDMMKSLPVGISVTSEKNSKTPKAVSEKKKPLEDLLGKLPGIRLVSKKVVKQPKPATAHRSIFSCPKCPQIFSSQERLNIHENNCLESELMIKKKPNIFKSKQSELYYFDKFQNIYICTTCHQEFAFKSEIDEHIEKKHSGFKCNICDAYFPSLVELSYHSAKHNPSKAMTCPLCHFKTVIRSKLAFHIQTEHAVDTKLTDAQYVRFACVVCTKTFYNEGKLIRHQKNYHKASIDNEPSMGARLLTPKIKSEHPQPLNLLCDNCGKSFSSKYRLVRHQKAMHEGLKPWICRFCNRGFTGKDTMQKHERIHTGERPYSCEYCGKCFRQPGPFTVHLRIHTGERPYKCKFCKKGFITNQTKKVHMKRCLVRDVEINDTNVAFYTDYVFDNSKKRTRATNKQKNFKEASDDEDLDLLTRLKLKKDEFENVKPKNKVKKRPGVQSWNCDRCKEVFYDTKLWQRHKHNKDCSFEPLLPEKTVKKRVRKPSRTYACKYCDQTLTNYKLFQAHNKTHKQLFPDETTEEKPNYKFDEIQELFICNVCSAEFQLEAEAKDHMKSHEKILSCTICNSNFKTYIELGVHSAVHNSENKIKCPLCTYETTTSSIYCFKTHVNYVHLRKFPYFCKECGRGFRHIKFYQDHQNIHSGKKPYICVVCLKGFPYPKYLNMHQVRNHQVGTSGRKIEHECKTCNRHFYKPEALAVHFETCYKRNKKTKSGTPAKSFLCDTCGQTFTERAKLLEHLRVHRGDLPFVCSWCGKRFPVLSYLKTHERVHTGEKPYECEFCGKRFGQHAPFRVHRRTHTGERPYVCEFCTRGFTTNQGLKLHKKNCTNNRDGNLTELEPVVISPNIVLEQYAVIGPV